MDGWRLVVVGDLKTPHASYENLDGVTYLHPQNQVSLDPELSKLIGWNCIQRRNMGFLYAARHGAELVATVDDDNLPLPGWGEFDPLPTVNIYDSYQPVIDPLSVVCDCRWHRGFPATLVGGRYVKFACRRQVTAGVQANLWNGDPDIDAICRAMYPGQVRYDGIESFAAKKPMPFNSQNTILTRAALADYFCFPGVGRYDDIYASYVCQAYGHRVVFGEATVSQARSGHDLATDMAAEVDGYVNCERFVRALTNDREAWRQFIPAASAAAFDRYRELMRAAA